ncbi:MAG TPA: hypothetical protein VGD78_06855 [Chthoniobacterales bacterium]
MKSFFVLVACSVLIFAGCERHPVAQLQEINERSDLNPEKKNAKADGEPDRAQTEPGTKANPSPRAYFPTDAK